MRLSEIHGDAIFSADGRRRHRLDRWWADGPRALVCGANPSKAGAIDNDPTILRLVTIISNLDLPGFTMVNASDLIATDPKEHDRLASAEAWNRPASANAARDDNLRIIRALSGEAAIRIVAWGNLVGAGLASQLVLDNLSHGDRFDLYAFGTINSGAPIHPMARGKHRIADDVKPIIWQPAGREALKGKE